MKYADNSDTQVCVLDFKMWAFQISGHEALQAALDVVINIYVASKRTTTYQF